MKRGRWIVIILLSVIIAFAYWKMVPRSFSTMQNIAYREFEDYFREEKVDIEIFDGPIVNLGNEDYVIFQWSTLYDGETLLVGLRVPRFSKGSVEIVFYGDSEKLNELFVEHYNRYIEHKKKHNSD